MINPLNRPLLACGAVMVLCAWSGTRPRHRVESKVISSPHASQADEQAVDDLMGALRRKFQKSTKEYDAAVERIDEAVNSAIKEATWLGGLGDGTERPLAEHPFFTLIDRLAKDALEPTKEKKNSKEKVALLTQYPWSSSPEFLLGLSYGAEREISKHSRGFISLGQAPVPLPGFPDLLVNHYLYGLDEIVGWNYRVRRGKQPKYEGRSVKTLPELATVLPSWERLRVHLLGSTPEVALFAIPQLTRQIHSRLAERRSEGSSERPHMDEFLTLLDSKWDGFVFDGPGARENTAFVIPAHWLFTDTRGFSYQFRASQALAGVGDLPFLAIQTFEQFATLYRNESLTRWDFIGSTPKAVEVRRQFDQESSYLIAYKKLIDMIVRAILVPNTRYPTYMASYDYPGGRVPPVREVDYAFDMPRRHAPLVWAYVGKDPEALADFLYDEFLSNEAYCFPQRESLSTQFLLRSREMESEMLKSIAERMAGDSGGAPERDNAAAGDFEREFSPHLTYRTARGDRSAAFLAFSYHSFHGLPARVIREAAREAIFKELEE